MLFAIQNFVVKGALLVSLLGSTLTGLVGGEELEALQQQYDQTVQQREGLLDRMKTLEQRYEKLVDRIDALKSEGTDNLANRMSVEDLLRQSREVAERLERLQQRVGRTDATLKKLRTEIIRRIDASVQTVEQRLREAPADQRVALVDQLNELRSIRRTYRTPLPEAPDLKEINETLELVATVESGRPDQMQAAADELEDTEDQLRERLNAVRDHLEELRRAKTLARRARTFRAEERFFDEANRPRSVGHHRQDDSAGEANDGDNTVSEGNAGAPAPNNDPPESDEGANYDGPSAGAPGDQPPSRSPGNSRDGFNGTPESPKTSPTGGPTDPRTGAPPQGSPSEQGGGAGSAFESPEFVLENDADPSRSVSSTFASESELEARIKSLKREEKQLRRQAERLEDKARKLRKEAEEMEELD